MSLSKFENMVANQLLFKLSEAWNIDKRIQAYAKVEKLLSSILDDSVIITTFGSGPLKTYLPESDIDITILFTNYFLKSEKLDTPSWIGTKELNKLKETLEINAEEYRLEDVTIINAAVKLIKLYCNGIQIDISFNQIGGICTFSYLEAVDQLVGKDHLFKKAILLIKAWCMYEGRILGSNIGCISSYTLEVLMVHLLIRWRDLIQSPLDLFFKFFETNWWDNAVTIFGLSDIDEARSYPVLLEKVDDFVEDDDSKSKLILDHYGLVQMHQERLRKLWDKYNVTLPSEALISLDHHLNIVDPIYPCNNLGKCISNFNSKRIQRIIIKQRQQLIDFTRVKEDYRNGSASVQDIINYKQRLTSLFQKTFQIIEVHTLDQTTQWMQVKLSFNSNNTIYSNLLNPNTFVNQNLQFPVECIDDKKFNSEFLKGDNVMFEYIWMEPKNSCSSIKERKSSFSSTWKSTVNSHQENIPSIQGTINEEIKKEDSYLKSSKYKSQSVRPIRSGAKNQKCKQLDYHTKLREPLTVRKFEKNTDASGTHIDLSRNSIHYFSTLN